MTDKKNSQNRDSLTQLYHEMSARRKLESNRVKFMEGAFFGMAQIKLQVFYEVYKGATEEQRAEIMATAKRYYDTAESLAKKYCCIQFIQPHFDAYEKLKELAEKPWG